MTTLLLLGLIAAVGLAWGLLAVRAWPVTDARHSGRPLRLLLWAIALTAVACSVLMSQGMKVAAQTLTEVAGFAFPAVLLAAIVGTWGIQGRAVYKFIPIALLAFSAVIATSALLNSQIGEVTWAIAVGLLYLPGLTAAIWRTSLSRQNLRQTVCRIGLSIVWMSLAYTVVDLHHALGDLPRRLMLPGIEFRLAGVTPHPNGLAFIAALALFLTMRERRRFWLLHTVACIVILFLAEARTLTVGLMVALAAYWIVSARKSRMVRAVNAAAFCAPIAVFLWPSIVSSFEETSLGSDVTTLNSRTTVWQLVADNWTQHPVLGWGAFTFDNNTGSPLSALFFNNSHNQFLEALIEGGLVGLLLIVGVAIVLAWSVLTTRDASYVAVTIMTLFFMMTEVPLTLHNYGFGFSVVLGSLLLAILIPGPVNYSSPYRAKHAFSGDAPRVRLENVTAPHRTTGTSHGPPRSVASVASLK